MLFSFVPYVFLAAAPLHAMALKYTVNTTVSGPQSANQSLLRVRSVSASNISSRSGSNFSFTAKEATVLVVDDTAAANQQADVEVMMCVPVRNPSWLRLLRRAWLDEASHNKNMKVTVFIPKTPAYTGEDFSEAAQGLNMVRLVDWHGDVSSFQGAFTGAIRPCTQQAASAKWYAMLDDDVILLPHEFLEMLATFDHTRRTVWGRKGEANFGKHIVYGGVMVMSRATSVAIADNLDNLFEPVNIEAMNRKCKGYAPPVANVDAFFSIAVQLLGGTVQEIDGIVDFKPEIPEHAHLPSGRCVAMHHVSEADLLDYVSERHSMMHMFEARGVQTQLRQWCESRSECLRKNIEVNVEEEKIKKMSLKP